MVTIGVTIKEIGIFKKDLFRFQKKERITIGNRNLIGLLKM